MEKPLVQMNELKEILSWKPNYKSPATAGPIDERFNEPQFPAGAYAMLMQKYHGLYTEGELHKLHLIWAHVCHPFPPPNDIIEACKETWIRVDAARKAIGPIKHVKPAQMIHFKEGAEDVDEVQVIQSPLAIVSMQECLLADSWSLWENLTAAKSESERMGCPMCGKIVGCRCGVLLQTALIVHDNRAISANLLVQEGLFTSETANFKLLWPVFAARYPVIAVKIRHPSQDTFVDQWYYHRSQFCNYATPTALIALGRVVRDMHKAWSAMFKRANPKITSGPNFAARLLLGAAASGLEVPVMTKPDYSQEEIAAIRGIGSHF